MWVVSFYFLHTNDAELNILIHVKFEKTANFFGVDFIEVGAQGESLFILNLWYMFA